MDNYVRKQMKDSISSGRMASREIHELLNKLNEIALQTNKSDELLEIGKEFAKVNGKIRGVIDILESHLNAMDK